MTEYTIKLSSISDCRKYCSLLEEFQFSGYLEAEHVILDKDDILGIMEKCLLQEIQLVVGECTERERTAIESFLKRVSLLAA